MTVRQVASTALRTVRAGVISAAVFQFAIGSSLLRPSKPILVTTTPAPLSSTSS